MSISQSRPYRSGHSSVPTLPQETFELIIDELRDSAEALASCSLVRRSWLPRSRHHLFRHIELNIVDPEALDTGPEAPRSSNRHSSSITASRCVSTNDFSPSFSNPEIVACVRGLSLNITYPQSTLDSHNHGQPHSTARKHIGQQRDQSGYTSSFSSTPTIPFTIPFTELRYLSLCCGDIEIVDTKDSRLKRLMTICTMADAAILYRCEGKNAEDPGGEQGSGRPLEVWVDRWEESLWHLSLDIPSSSVKDYFQNAAFESASKLSILQLFLSRVEDLQPILQTLASTSHQACRLVRLHLDFDEPPTSDSLQQVTLYQTAILKFLQSVPSVRSLTLGVGAMGLEHRRFFRRTNESCAISLYDLFPTLIGRGIVELGSPEQWWKDSGM
ncbi:hypothetical protein K435DRAFT_855017 [Dendrothele bispora CBS 962.96]|uniref:F-box domain-containing protein n=1 Tax=Dendrothele bispora (strain CBS 962.96) TaxID=1314807 RepID=A0A4S8MCC4_DENBC|nr:hypothetical protein K435DRAFT_855017 [Dendrothele bispora CBS 962.96]